VEWSEVCYVRNAIGHSKKGLEYRYLAKREVLDKQQELPGMDRQIELPFPTMDIKSQSYKVFGMVTNMDWEGECDDEEAGDGRLLVVKERELQCFNLLLPGRLKSQR
jgi:hypothetical protein